MAAIDQAGHFTAAWMLTPDAVQPMKPYLQTDDATSAVCKCYNDYLCGLNCVLLWLGKPEAIYLPTYTEILAQQNELTAAAR